MNFFENLLENFREAPALTACVVFCAAAIFFLPDEGRIALLKNLSVGVFAIPLGIHIWRRSRLDHLDEGFPLFTTLIFLARRRGLLRRAGADRPAPPARNRYH